MKSLLFFCFLSATILNANAQNLSIKEIHEDLRGPILKDSKGRLWFAGPKKITYYNGIWNDQNLPAPASYNPNVTNIREPLLIREDNTGNIWTCSKEGILQFDGVSWKLHNMGKMNFANTTMIFVDKKNRIYFLNINYEIAIYDNGNWTYLTKGLPNGINTFTEGDNEVLFGNSEKPVEVGVFNGSYRLEKSGDKLKLFKLMNDKATVIEYSKQKNLTSFIKILLSEDDKVIDSEITEQGAVLIYPDKIVIRSVEGEREVTLNTDIQKAIKTKENISTITTYKDKLYIGLNIGLLEIVGTHAKLLGISDGLADEHIVLLHTDPNGNLLALHKKAASISIDGVWKKYDKSNGFEFDFKGYNLIHILEWNKQLILCNYLVKMGPGGKANICIFENNKWSTYQSNFEYSKPEITSDGTLIFGGIKGGRLDGICYFKNGVFQNFNSDNGMPAKITKLIHVENDLIWITSVSLMNETFVSSLTFDDSFTK